MLASPRARLLAFLGMVTFVLAGCNSQPPPDSAAGGDLTPKVGWEQRGEQMQKIATAINAHYDKHNRFPSYTLETDTIFERPKLSWRVWILPELGEAELFAQFKTDEAWDSPHNKPLLEKMPAIFALDGVKTGMAGGTCIQSLSGDGSILGSEKPGLPPSRQGIVDGEAATALLVECDAASAVPWTKPDDFEFDPAAEADVTRFGREGEPFFLIVTVNGDVHRISKQAAVKDIDFMFQRDNQRETPWAKLDYQELPAKDSDGGK